MHVHPRPRWQPARPGFHCPPYILRRGNCCRKTARSSADPFRLVNCAGHATKYTCKSPAFGRHRHYQALPDLAVYSTGRTAVAAAFSPLSGYGYVNEKTLAVSRSQPRGSLELRKAASDTHSLNLHMIDSLSLALKFRPLIQGEQTIKLTDWLRRVNTEIENILPQPFPCDLAILWIDLDADRTSAFHLRRKHRCSASHEWINHSLRVRVFGKQPTHQL